VFFICVSSFIINLKLFTSVVNKYDKLLSLSYMPMIAVFLEAPGTPDNIILTIFALSIFSISNITASIYLNLLVHIFLCIKQNYMELFLMAEQDV